MSWMQTLWGNEYDPLNPDETLIYTKEVAHSLAMQCRFNGHVKQFYSVAQHSVLVSNLLEDWGAPLEVIKQGLLHDAAEAYTGDVISPIKQELPNLQIIEEYNHQAVARRFGLDYPFHSDVKRADITMLLTERRDLMRKPPRPWFNNEHSFILPGWEIGPELQWREARDQFMDRFSELWW